VRKSPFGEGTTDSWAGQKNGSKPPSFKDKAKVDKRV
jgi:hypothetical protein